MTLSRRAVAALDEERARCNSQVRPGSTVVDQDGYWWTYAGARANTTLAAALTGIIASDSRPDNDRLRLRADLAPGELHDAIAALDVTNLPEPTVDYAALRGLKFAESLPPALAMRTLAERISDREGARQVLREPRTIVNDQAY